MLACVMILEYCNRPPTLGLMGLFTYMSGRLCCALSAGHYLCVVLKVKEPYGRRIGEEGEGGRETPGSDLKVCPFFSILNV